MKGRKDSIFWSQISPTLCSSSFKVGISHHYFLYSFLTFKMVLRIYSGFLLNAYSSGVYFPLNCSKIFTLTGKTSWKKCPISMLTELSALSFLISVLIINTDKMCGHITLFILIWSFKTRSLCWALMTFEDGMSSHQISKWL